MTSPYVRRLRLGRELRKLREARGLTTDDLAAIVFMSRSKITKLETAQIRPDLTEVVTIFKALEVEGDEWNRLFQLAHEASQRSWWDRYSVAMGPRQRLFADLESGAATIRHYDPLGIPAVLQAPEFVDALVELDQAGGPISYRPERMIEARYRRQKHLFSPSGPLYDTVLDEVVIRRLAIPREVMIRQLRHLVTVVESEPRFTVRLLPTDVQIPGGLLPRSSFLLYTFPDKADPPIAVVGTITADLVLTERGELARYTRVYERLREATLTPEASLTFLRETADRLAEKTGSA